MRRRAARVACTLSLCALSLSLAGCRDLSRFSTAGGGKFEGSIATGAFVRSGFTDVTTACMTLDTDHLQDGPGEISTSDGRFKHALLRPIPELFHDPLSTLSFGEGRVKNFLYVARPDGDPTDTSDVTVVVSLLQSNEIEVRMLRSAPDADAGVDAGVEPRARLFGVFGLTKGDGACSY